MAVATHELKALLTDRWKNSISSMSVEQVTEYRSLKLTNLDGKDMPQLHSWPTNIRRLLFKTVPGPSNRETTKLFIFLVGNGCSPLAAGTWILTYHGLCTWKKRNHQAYASINRIVSIHGSMLLVENTMYYWDIRENRKLNLVESKALSMSKCT